MSCMYTRVTLKLVEKVQSTDQDHLVIVLLGAGRSALQSCWTSFAGRVATVGNIRRVVLHIIL